ncbi:ankyrin repeat domain-containing protein [Micromonospora sp. IBHARD004]|uniref:ankyrin repeat domain-containing protein n=1 Tax=Micromonospora sp. IBHARD004 TaxID=3457764 RepID=UPI00405A4642
MRRAAPAVLRILFDHGADPNQRRSDETPVLVLAARRGDHAAVDVLLQAGADIDAGDALGRTALMHAVERDERAVVAVLRLAGADTERATPTARRPWSWPEAGNGRTSSSCWVSASSAWTTYPSPAP